MGVVKEKYSNAKLNMLQEVLSTDADSGEARDFEVWVDDLKVIQRTSNAERFDSYESFINADTRSVTIVIYEKSSRRNTRYIFLLKEEDSQKEKDAAKSDVEKSLNEKLDQQKKEWQHELLLKEKEQIKVELKEAEKHIEDLEKALADFKDKRNMIGNLHIGEIASVALEGIARRNPQLLAKIPGGEGLAGIIIKDNDEKARQISVSQEPETEATFNRCESKEETISEEDKNFLNFLKQLQGKFDGVQIVKVMSVLDMLAENTTSIDSTIEFLQNKIQSKNSV